MKRLLSIAEATAHEILRETTPKKATSKRLGTELAHCILWDLASTLQHHFRQPNEWAEWTCLGWPLQYFPPLFSTLLDQCRSRTRRPRTNEFFREQRNSRLHPRIDWRPRCPGPCAGTSGSTSIQPQVRVQVNSNSNLGFGFRFNPTVTFRLTPTLVEVNPNPNLGFLLFNFTPKIMEFQTLTSKISDFGCKFQNVAKSKFGIKYDCSKWLYTFIRFFLSCAMADRLT